MGLYSPVTKVWDIPEPTPTVLPKEQPAEPAPEPAKPEKERELVPAGKPFWKR